jgi:hypothetical protein
VLFYDLDGTLWALNLACPAHEAFVRLGGNRFAVFHFVHAHGTRANACCASVAFVVINNYLDQALFPSGSDFLENPRLE